MTDPIALARSMAYRYREEAMVSTRIAEALEALAEAASAPEPDPAPEAPADEEATS